MTDTATCTICPRNCVIPEGNKGFCSARSNKDGEIICDNYGIITSIGLDQIEKKPLRRYMPGGKVLSLGSYGCNLSCGFCQNHRISMSDGRFIQVIKVSPEDVASKALEQIPDGNIGVAYTYNEPMIGYEFIRDCSEIIRRAGLKNVVVSNGYMNREPLEQILPLIDAANIDLKAFNNEFYKKIGGNLEDVKRSITLYAGSCHLELTCLIIPGENDSPQEIQEMCKWISSVDEEIPLHLSRFFPAYDYSDHDPTARESVDDLYEIASTYLKYVYKGNY